MIQLKHKQWKFPDRLSLNMLSIFQIQLFWSRKKIPDDEKRLINLFFM